jgi:hypothetical protein
MEGRVAYPAVAAIWIVIWALRALGVLKQPARSPVSVRPGMLVIVARLIAAGTAFAMVENESGTVRLLVLLLVAILCTPSLIIKWIAIPLRMPKLAYWTTRVLRPLGSGHSVKSVAVCHAARALMGQRQPKANDIAWLEERLSGAAKGRGAMLLGEGLLLTLRGDLAGARSVLRAVDALHPAFTQPALRRIARDWLVADAAALGSWDEVIERGVRSPRKTRWSYAVGRMAQRLTGDVAAPHRVTLVALFIVAPRRIATWSLLRRALKVPGARPLYKPNSDQPPALSGALAKLARLHENLVGSSKNQLLDAVVALETAIESTTTRAHVEKRVLALGARRTPDSLIAEFREQVEVSFGTLLGERVPTPLNGNQPQMLAGAAQRARQRILRNLEMYCTDYKERTRTDVSLTELEEWRTWVQVRDCGERLLAFDPSAEAALFQVVYVAVCNFAVFQHNHHQRHGLSHQMFDWLHQRAQSLGSATESALMAKNMKAALGQRAGS